jgi:hypothetical protein
MEFKKFSSKGTLANIKGSVAKGGQGLLFWTEYFHGDIKIS